MHHLINLQTGKSFLRALLLSFVVFTGVTSALAQTPAEVHGVVSDESGEPLIGATVRLKGSKHAVVTDFDGNYKIAIDVNNPVIEFSYVGYEPKSVKVTSPELNVTLKSTTEQLDEYVVVAYGTQKKATVTGSIATVDNKEIIKSSMPNISAAIAGKLAGLTTMQSSGAPGKDDVQMYLRGAATTNDKNPLILVDGVPRESIREIDANEVASISVLKDASATAVFGVRGANGVILITTRRGQEGKVSVKGSVKYSIQEFTRTPYRHNSWEYARLLNEARANDGQAPMFSEQELAYFDAWKDGNGPEDPEIAYWYPNTNWNKMFFKDHSDMVNANVNISGGSKKISYFINTGYVYQGGMYKAESKDRNGYNPQAKMNRYNIRSNIDYTFSPIVKASLDVSSFIEKVNGTNGLENVVWADAITERPTTPGPLTQSGIWLKSNYIIDGSDLRPAKEGLIVKDPATTLESGYGHMNRSGYHLFTRSGLNAIGTVTVNLDFLTKGLSLKGLASFESRGNAELWATRSFVTYGFERNPSGRVHPDNPDKPLIGYYTFDGATDADSQISLGRSSSSWWFLNLQLQANYDRTFNDVHKVTGMVLFQRDLRENSSGAIPFNMLGVASRFTYSYDYRYLAEVNMGYNGTEQFAKGRRFGFFPAFSLGWVASNEKFFEPLSPVFTDFKLRASVGKVGNDGLGSTRFLYLDNIKIVHDGGSNTTSLGNYNIVQISMLGNPNIKWETAWKQNYAIDLKLFKSLNLSFDYFIENRSDILIARRTIPQIGGFNSSVLPKVNMGKVKNQGYEISASYTYAGPHDLLLTLNGNFGYNNNKVISADEPHLSEDYAYRYRETGYPLGQGWGYLIDYTKGDGTGFFSTDDEASELNLQYETGGGNPHAGDFIYQDLNNDGIINERDLAPMKDAQLVPKFTYGFGFSANWKGIDFSIMFQGIGKYSKLYNGRGAFEEILPNYFSDFNDYRWSAERYANHEKITSPRLTITGSTSHTKNEFYYWDASYMRLKNIELGYTFPRSLTRKLAAQSMRVFVSGDNVYTWSHMPTKSFDPEQSDVLNYPLIRTWTCGLTIEF